jgi:hypothetical protein
MIVNGFVRMPDGFILSVELKKQGFSKDGEDGADSIWVEHLHTL